MKLKKLYVFIETSLLAEALNKIDEKAEKFRH